jgi:hypothetical protein
VFPACLGWLIEAVLGRRKQQNFAPVGGNAESIGATIAADVGRLDGIARQAGFTLEWWLPTDRDGQRVGGAAFPQPFVSCLPCVPEDREGCRHDVEQFGPVCRWVVKLPKRDEGHFLECNALHLGGDALLLGCIGRVQPFIA